VNSTLRYIGRFLGYHYRTLRPIRRPRPRAGILVYHRVARLALDPHGIAVSPTTFADHLRLLRANYRVASLEWLLDRLPDGAYPDRTIAVTLDDGYADTLTDAYPIAAGLDVPLTVFVAVKPVLAGEAFWWDELSDLLLSRTGHAPALALDGVSGEFAMGSEVERRESHTRLHALLRRLGECGRRAVMASIRAQIGSGPEPTGRPLTPAELRQLAGLPGIGVGSHTMTHARLGGLSAAEQASELVESKTTLEHMLGNPVALLAYPYGKADDLNADTLNVAKTAGYRAAFTTSGQPVLPSSHAYAVPRLTAHDWPVEVLRARLARLFGDRDYRYCQ